MLYGISALSYEVILAIAFSKVMPYFFGVVVYHIPLFALQRILKNKDRQIGAFWIAFMVGPALIVSFSVLGLRVDL